MEKPRILKYFTASKEKIGKISFEMDKDSKRPAWIRVKDSSFDARFISLRTESDSEIIYKRFTGNFYYPLDLVLRPEDEKKFYAKYAQYYDQNTAQNNRPMAKFLFKKMAKFRVNKDARILDLGAGTGLFSNLAAENGFRHLTLVDISKEMLAEAKKKPLLKDMDFMIADARRLNLKKKYDVVVSIMMFDDIKDKDIEQVFEKLLPNIKPGGLFLLIEDKERKAYRKFFKEVESGLFYITKEKDFAKYYFIGRCK